MSYCYLAECAREENQLRGHALSCSYGAGGDCTCAKGEFLAYIVTLVVGAKVMLVEVTDDLDAAKAVAVSRRGAGFKAVRLRSFTTHESESIFYDLRDQAEANSERLADWASEHEVPS